jgi:hypothetical protein
MTTITITPTRYGYEREIHSDYGGIICTHHTKNDPYIIEELRKQSEIQEKLKDNEIKQLRMELDEVKTKLNEVIDQVQALLDMKRMAIIDTNNMAKLKN